jgi:uncharacterized protein (TIGR02246 family)
MDPSSTDGGFIPYPTNRVVGTIAEAKHADAAVEALVEAGFDRPSIDVLRGEEGLRRLDPTGAEHGVLERLQRALVRVGAQVEEYQHLMRHVEDVRAGRCVVMVLAPRLEARTVAADILNAHGAEFVGFYGRWAWHGLAAESGAAVSGAGQEGHARAARPEDVPRLFADAWNHRDPDALASLFDQNAEFVNVTGVWSHNRTSIREAHADGLERIVKASTLTVDEHRVRHVSEDVAVVHAAMTLSGHAAIDGLKNPGTRTTIYSFVVHKVADRWMCVSAHSTDVVPNVDAISTVSRRPSA